MSHNSRQEFVAPKECWSPKPILWLSEFREVKLTSGRRLSWKRLGRPKDIFQGFYISRWSRHRRWGADVKVHGRRAVQKNCSHEESLFLTTTVPFNFALPVIPDPKLSENLTFNFQVVSPIGVVRTRGEYAMSTQRPAKINLLTFSFGTEHSARAFFAQGFTPICLWEYCSLFGRCASVLSSHQIIVPFYWFFLALGQYYKFLVHWSYIVYMLKFRF